MALADRRAEVELLVRHGGSLSAAEIDSALGMAVRRLSGHVPIVRVEAVAVQAGGTWLALPERWVVGVSRIVFAWLAGSSGDLPTDAVVWYSDGTSAGLRFAEAQPVGTQVVLHYTSDYRLTATEDEIPLRFQEAVAHYAAATCCRTLASLAAGSTDSTIAADTVDWRSAADAWRRLARDYEGRYYGLVGVDPGAEAGGSARIPAAGTTVQWDTRGESGATPLLPRRGR